MKYMKWVALCKLSKMDIFKKIAESASIYQESVDSKERIIVGVNDFIEQDEELDIEILKISRDAQDTQEHKIKTLRKIETKKFCKKR